MENSMDITHKELEREQLARRGIGEDIKPKYVKQEVKTRELSAKENLLKSHIVGIHDTRVGTGAWKPEGFAIFKRSKGEYYFVSWHSGRDHGIADYNEVRKWVKMNREHHG